MSMNEVRLFNEKLENVTIGIGHHFETLQGQIGERFDLLEKIYAEKFSEINRMLNHQTHSPINKNE